MEPPFLTLFFGGFLFYKPFLFLNFLFFELSLNSLSFWGGLMKKPFSFEPSLLNPLFLGGFLF
ncbi:hypothetical protein C2R82_03850 [Helicobacter pylori]|nr:hypothetical protein C2R82_03850 [Helicobacter pylori]